MQDAGAPVRVDREGPVARVVIDSPSNANALSNRVLAGLVAAFEACDADGEIRAVVLQATGSTFCAGADMAERLDPPPPGPRTTIAEALTAIARTTKPVLARVHGAVRGGGMGLVAAADLAAAPAGATFAFSEARLGVAPAVVAVPVLARMGRRSFERYALTADSFDAVEAARTGLLATSVADVGALDEWVDAVLASVLACAPEALAATKGLPELVARPWDEAMAATAELSDGLFASAQGREGMTAFFEKRRPSWWRGWP
jgi:enoyl-CoA hydratase/carnithine racemase